MRSFPAYAGVILTWPQQRPTFQLTPLKRELSKSVSSFLQQCGPAPAVVILTVRTVWRASLLPRVCGGYPYPAIIRNIGGENKNSRVYGSYPCSAELKLLIPRMRELSSVTE